MIESAAERDLPEISREEVPRPFEPRPRHCFYGSCRRFQRPPRARHAAIQGPAS